MTNLLKFGSGNAKLSTAIKILDLVAGYTCPYAKECLSKVNPLTRKLKDGPNCKYRCYAASIECTYKQVREKHWYNFNLLKNVRTIPAMAQLIQDSLPTTSYVRIHSSGDYFSESYFLSWLNIAKNNKSVIFYGYTKAVPLLIKYKKSIPSNFRLTASFGGTHDHLIKPNKLKYVETVFSYDEAKQKNLPIDHDDSLAIGSKSSFSLILHGIQPANSDAGKAMSLLRKQGWTGYNNNNQKRVKIFVS